MNINLKKLSRKIFRYTSCNMKLLWKFTRVNRLAKFAVVPLLSPMLMFYDSSCSFLEVGKHFYVVPPSVTNFWHKATCDRSNATVQRHFSLDYSPRFVPLFLFFSLFPLFPVVSYAMWHHRKRRVFVAYEN